MAATETGDEEFNDGTKSDDQSEEKSPVRARHSRAGACRLSQNDSKIQLLSLRSGRFTMYYRCRQWQVHEESVTDVMPIAMPR